MADIRTFTEGELAKETEFMDFTKQTYVASSDIEK